VEEKNRSPEKIGRHFCTTHDSTHSTLEHTKCLPTRGNPIIRDGLIRLCVMEALKYLKFETEELVTC